MHLKVSLPAKVLVDEEVTQVTVEAADGVFSLRPRHIDFVTALVPGILSFRIAGEKGEQETEEFAAVDTGILVKRGPDVMISTRRGVRGTQLEKLEETVENEFRRLDEREQQARVVLARLESNFIQRFIELE